MADYKSFMWKDGGKLNEFELFLYRVLSDASSSFAVLGAVSVSVIKTL